MTTGTLNLGSRLPGQFDDLPSTSGPDSFHPIYNGRRIYDTSTGKYLQPEPLLQVPEFAAAMASEGMSTPTYAYALNNPNRYFDPDGRNPWVFLGLGLWLANDQTTTDGSELGELLAGASVGGPVITKLLIRPTGGLPANPEGVFAFSGG